MKRNRSPIVMALFVLACAQSMLRADDTSNAPDSAAARSTHNDEAAALAAKIDEMIASQWASSGVKPAPISDDAEFLRRIYLDVAGKIPRVWEVRAFLADPRTDKRQRLIEDLLASPLYVNHFTDVWRALLLPEANNQQVQFFVPSFNAWIRQQVQKDVPYDQMVRELMTVSLGPGGRPQRLRATDPSPLAFYQASELKPENLAASTSRIFLGVKLQCAQCHDHPLAKWTRKQFWQYAAFFSGLQISSNNVFGPVKEVTGRREITIPGTSKTIQARLLDGTEPAWNPGTSTRSTLADWVTDAKNPFFAKTAANRLWAHFFGMGILEPVDEPGEENQPGHPELLDELARQLVTHKFDLKFLIRAITLSRTYQLTSTVTDPSQKDPRLFARMAIKGLSAEQLFDSLAQATGYRETAATGRRFGPPGRTPRAEFLARFANQDKRTEQQTSILQALLLMNGSFIADVTSIDRSETLAATIDAPFLKDPGERIEALYLVTLSRKPQAEELAHLVRYVADEDSKKALSDIFWSLLNSSEFLLNH
jgi:hypothetical protein